MKKRLTLCVLFACLITLGACSKKEDAPASPNTEPKTASQTEPAVEQSQEAAPTVGRVSQVTFNTVLELWENGDKDQAAKVFLTQDWQAPDVFAKGSVFDLSEAKFTQLSTAEQQQIKGQALAVAGQIKELVQYLARQAKQPGADLTVYRQALSEFGARLSGDDQLKLIQQVGRAVRMLVENQLGTKQ